MPYGIDTDAYAQAVASAASNVSSSTGNSAFTCNDLAIYFPQFAKLTTTIPTEVQTLFIEMANASLSEERWRSKWKYAMSLYVAHFLTLWLQTQAGSSTNLTAAQVISAAKTNLVASSKGVGDVSVSYDMSSIANSLPGWGEWLTTTYGAQLAQMARYLPSAKAGMYVY